MKTVQTPNKRKGSRRIGVDAQTHLLSGVRQLASPNCDERPDAADISLLVIHAISLPPDQFGGRWIDGLFLN
ncbi:MAG: 1,6-anhydro-N-acetylmuramyl-L-alanine amidase AmpD, partial [Stenotrophobium sp.]